MLERVSTFENNGPILYLVATPIGNLKEMSPRALEVLNEVDLIACEDTRNTGRLLHHFNYQKELFSLHAHNEKEASKVIISLLKEGKKIAYVSDAGYPLISDPGRFLAQEARKNQIPIAVINGPSAFLMALIASNLASDRFFFHGFLPVKSGDRRKELEKFKDFPYTTIYYEAPHRLKSTLNDFLKVFGASRRLTLARELTKIHEEYIYGTIGELSELLKEEELKGEIVLVVEGKEKEQNTISSSLLSDLENELENCSPSVAVKNVAKKYQLPRGDIYKEYLKLKEKK